MAKQEKIIGNHIDPDALTECMVKLTGLQRETYNLYEAISNNDLEEAKKAIKKGANVNAPNSPCAPEGEETPLDSALYWAGSYDCSMEMIKLLRENGARSLNRDMDKFFEQENNCHLEKTSNKKKFRQ